MCYSGTCYFENYMGDCTLSLGYKDFATKYGCDPCIAGRYAGIEPETAESYHNYAISAMIRYKKDEREKRNGLHNFR